MLRTAARQALDSVDTALEIDEIKRQALDICEHIFGTRDDQLFEQASNKAMGVNEGISAFLDTAAAVWESPVSHTNIWLARSKVLRQNVEGHAEVEQKAASMNTELLALAKDNKIKVSRDSGGCASYYDDIATIISHHQDENLQESAVKIALLEKRMEALRQQVSNTGDSTLRNVLYCHCLTSITKSSTVDHYEKEIGKLRHQEKMYTDVIDGLHADLAGVEKDNAELKRKIGKLEKMSTSRGSFAGSGDALGGAGSLAAEQQVGWDGKIMSPFKTCFILSNFA